jgi:hypothetical protein
MAPMLGFTAKLGEAITFFSQPHSFFPIFSPNTHYIFHYILCLKINSFSIIFTFFPGKLSGDRQQVGGGCGSQKCGKLKVFSFFSYTSIFSILSSTLSQKSHYTAQQLDFTDKFTLGHHGGVTGTHLDQLLPNNHYISPNPITTLKLHRHPQYSTHSFTYIYTLYISLLHITSYLQPKLVYFPCMTAAAYTTTLTCKHNRT